MEPFIEVRNISKAFAGVHALDNVGLSIGKGEIRALIGENGSGKSTLIKIIGGAFFPDRGTLRIEERDHQGLTAIESVRAGIQVIYQNIPLFPNLSVVENIAMNQMVESEKTWVDWRTVRAISERALAAIGEKMDLDERVENLSIANRQIVAISRALTQNARLIILDEATSAITREEINHLFEVIRRLKERGIAFLFVSHKLSELFEICETVTVLRDGRKVGDYRIDELTNDRLVYLMTGKEFATTRYEFSDSEEVPLLRVRNFCRQGEFRDINLDVKKGEILGITGLIGSGRTEIANAIFGLTHPDQGRVEFQGVPVNIRTPRDAIRRGVAYLPEDRLSQGLFQTQPVGANLIVSVLSDLLGFLGLFSRKKERKVVDKWISHLKIKTPSDRVLASTLSGGNQQRLVIGKWLATKPSVFILDGPTIGIDIGSKYTIHSIIRQLAQQGMGIIVISDEVSEILENCNRVLVVSKGRIIREIKVTASTTEAEILDTMNGDFNQGERL